MIDAIVTMPPHAGYIDEVLRHPIVSGIRLNVVMPIKGTLEETLKRLDAAARQYGKQLWIDLKGRQLRVVGYAEPPFTEIILSHAISVDTPVTAYFKNGEESATVLEADGNRLIMQDGPRRMVGPGESVNIPHPSLKIEGYFTAQDKQYIEAAARIGLHQYMLSFVESAGDGELLRKMDPAAIVAAKIESARGMHYVRGQYASSDGMRLMAARGDLFIELPKPHLVLAAAEDILRKDPHAIAASRIFDSLERSLEPSCADINDADNLLRMGYKTVMLGDQICMTRESVISGLNLLAAIAERYS